MRQRWDVVNRHQGRREGRKNPAVLSAKSCELASFVCVATRFKAEARLVWAQTRHNSRESIGIRDALVMYAVRIAVDILPR